MDKEELDQLFNFYGAKDKDALIEEMSNHIDRFQVKLAEAENNSIRPIRYNSSAVPRLG